MKRTILFKAKRKDNNQWVEGDLLTNDVLRKFAIVTNGCIINAVIPETICQFTGLTDKNGDKIFEWDRLNVCKNKNGTLIVEFVNAYVGGWVLTHYSTRDKLSLGARDTLDLEIIGNIHD